LLEDCGALETLRLLLNFESAGAPMLTLVLIGQMNLVSAVSRLPALEERIAVKALLRSFTLGETAEYVRHRLNAAGAAREIFTADALESLHYLGHGVARQINRLGDLALLVGYADELPRLTGKQIEAVSEELVTIATE
jgi:general secretion pathway protein A